MIRRSVSPNYVTEQAVRMASELWIVPLHLPSVSASMCVASLRLCVGWECVRSVYVWGIYSLIDGLI